MKFYHLFITCLFLLTLSVNSILGCFNRGSSVSSSSSTGGFFGPAGFNGQQVSSSVQCTNGVCTHQNSQQTFG